MLWSSLTAPFVEILKDRNVVRFNIGSLIKTATGDGADRVDVEAGSMRGIFVNQTPLGLACPLYTKKANRMFPLPEETPRKEICFNPRCEHNKVGEAVKVPTTSWLKCPQCAVTHFCSRKCRSLTLAIHQKQCTHFKADMVRLYYRMLRAVEERLEGTDLVEVDAEEDVLYWPVPVSLTRVLEPDEMACLVQRTIIYARESPEWKAAMSSYTAPDDIRCFVCGTVCKFGKMLVGGQLFGVTDRNAVAGWVMLACSPACAEEISPENPFVPHICFEASLKQLKDDATGFAACLGACFEPGIMGDIVFSDHKAPTGTFKKN